MHVRLHTQGGRPDRSARFAKRSTLGRVDWSARYTQWVATHPLIAGPALFALGATLLALENVVLGEKWGDRALTTLMLMGSLAVFHVWLTRGVHRSRA